MTPDTLAKMIAACPWAKLMPANPKEEWKGHIMTSPVRLMFADLAEPRPYTNAAGQIDASKPPRYGCTVVIPLAGTDGAKLLADECRKLLIARYGQSGAHMPLPLKSSDTPTKKGEIRSQKYKGFVPGSFFFGCNSQRKPKFLVGGTEGFDAAHFYPGAWVRLTVHAYLYKAGANEGVSVGLDTVQFLAHDERLGGGAAAPDMPEAPVFPAPMMPAAPAPAVNGAAPRGNPPSWV